MSCDSLILLYDRYLEEADRVERNRKPGEGIFGLGKKPADDPCHDRFATDLKDWLEAFSREEPDSDSVRKVLSRIYHAPKEHPDAKSAFWMLIAVQGLTLDLIPKLSKEDARELATEYGGLYKRRERLPVQKRILDLLLEAAR